MKKVLFCFALMLSLALSQKSQAQSSVTIDADYTSWVAIISDEYAATYEYGWWSVWREMVEEGNYQTIDDEDLAVFPEVPEGYYTIVVYTEDAADSDGVVLESVYIDGSESYDFYFGVDDFIEWNCLSCPFLYVFDGKKYVKTTEIIQDIVGKERKTTTTHPLSPEVVIDGKVKIRIQEEKDEISHLDKIQLVADGKIYNPICIRQAEVTSQLLAEDENYLILQKGQFVELEFEVGNSVESLELQATGYYIPDPEFLEAVYYKYLRKK